MVVQGNTPKKERPYTPMEKPGSYLDHQKNPGKSIEYSSKSIKNNIVWWLKLVFNENIQKDAFCNEGDGWNRIYRINLPKKPILNNNLCLGFPRHKLFEIEWKVIHGKIFRW